MNLVALTEELIKALAVNKEAVSVKEFPSDEDNIIIIHWLSIHYEWLYIPLLWFTWWENIGGIQADRKEINGLDNDQGKPEG